MLTPSGAYFQWLFESAPGSYLVPWSDFAIMAVLKYAGNQLNSFTKIYSEKRKDKVVYAIEDNGARFTMHKPISLWKGMGRSRSEKR
ncbi:hypothetical protein [Terrimonas pollutisoli]|uniref:hypothetical protein n=1 Tax=Terrimonas pollutisoli TaxID=3034147 RepID=UPI0023EC7359|nr:hypothetical protein [Terrimonas sp. H1YJ31]